LSFDIWQWSLLVLGALTIGITKTGIPGLSIMFVAVFSNIMPAKQATGLVLPLLILGDVVAVSIYRRHAVMKHVFRLFPWAAVGIIIGTVALRVLDDKQARLLLGTILISMILLHVCREWRHMGRDLESEVVGHALWFAPIIGIGAGFTTQVSNAAGTIMILYFVAMRLPKMEFIGTGAIYFLALNIFKTPFMVGLGMINLDSLRIDLMLAPAVLLGALIGRFALKRINQVAFLRVALTLAFVGSIKLLF
jgi:uncharacterized membrane protein YfcA